VTLMATLHGTVFENIPGIKDIFPWKQIELRSTARHYEVIRCAVIKADSNEKASRMEGISVYLSSRLRVHSNRNISV